MIKEITVMIIVITICITAYSISKVYSPYSNDCEACECITTIEKDWSEYDALIF